MASDVLLNQEMKTLVVSHADAKARSSLRQRLPDTDIVWAEDCGSAFFALQDADDIESILTEVSFPDGNWYSVLRMAIKQDVRGTVKVLCSDPSETLTCEVVARGGVMEPGGLTRTVGT